MTHSPNTPKSWVRLSDIIEKKIYPGSKSSFLREVKAGTMPRPITIAKNCRAWCEEDIRAELERRALINAAQHQDRNLHLALKRLVEVDRILKTAMREEPCDVPVETRDRAIQLAHSVLGKLNV